MDEFIATVSGAEARLGFRDVECTRPIQCLALRPIRKVLSLTDLPGWSIYPLRSPVRGKGTNGSAAVCASVSHLGRSISSGALK